MSGPYSDGYRLKIGELIYVLNEVRRGLAEAGEAPYMDGDTAIAKLSELGAQYSNVDWILSYFEEVKDLAA